MFPRMAPCRQVLFGTATHTPSTMSPRHVSRSSFTASSKVIRTPVGAMIDAALTTGRLPWRPPTCRDSVTLRVEVPAARDDAAATAPAEKIAFPAGEAVGWF